MTENKERTNVVRGKGIVVTAKVPAPVKAKRRIKYTAAGTPNERLGNAIKERRKAEATIKKEENFPGAQNMPGITIAVPIRKSRRKKKAQRTERR